MGNPDDQANSFGQSDVSENQDKTADVYFGVFFDAVDMSLMSQLIGDRGEYMRKAEGAVSDVKNSSAYKTVDEVAAWAKFATDVLPDNPVSKGINKGLEAKNKVENLVDGAFGKANKLNDDISDTMGKVPTSFGTGTEGTESEGDAGESLVGSRSIISKLEPKYIGGTSTQVEEVEKEIITGVKVSKTNVGASYNFRVYVTGAVTNQELKQKESANAEENAQMDEGARKQLAKDAVDKAISKIEENIQPCKQIVHFDIFGYAKDPAVNDFIPEIDTFKQNPYVNEILIDYKGLYKNFHDKDEVLNDMGEETRVRFRGFLNNL